MYHDIYIFIKVQVKIVWWQQETQSIVEGINEWSKCSPPDLRYISYVLNLKQIFFFFFWFIFFGPYCNALSKLKVCPCINNKIMGPSNNKIKK